MKRTLLPIIACFIALLFAGCGGPRSTAQSFTQALAKGKQADAAKYCTEDAARILAFAGSQSQPNFKFVFVREEVDGDKARVWFKNGEDGPVERIDLVKVDGSWKVHINK